MNINKIVLEMMELKKKLRPNSDKILGEKNLWALDIDELDIDLSQLPLTELIEENFHKFFIKTKLEFR